MKIPDKVKVLFNETDLISFATVDKKGLPNVIAVFWKKIINDKTIILLDNFMNKTIKNLKGNNRVCLSFWDGKTEQGYQIKGEAKYFTKGKIYNLGKDFIQKKCPGRLPKGVIKITVKQIYNISPGPDAGKKI